MSKTLSRTLYMLSLLAWIIGGCLLLRGLVGGAVLPYAAYPAATTIGVLALCAGLVLACISWIGALIRTARLGSWRWFVCLLLFSGIALLLYIFIGPQAPVHPLIPVTTPPYNRYGR